MASNLSRRKPTLTDGASPAFTGTLTTDKGIIEFDNAA